MTIKLPKWQDLVLMVGNVGLSASLVPTVIYGTPPPLATIYPTIVILLAFSATFFNLRLRFSGVAVGLTAMLWGTLAVRAIFNIGF